MPTEQGSLAATSGWRRRKSNPFFSRPSSLNRKASRALQRDNVKGDNEDGNNKDDDLLLEEKLEYLEEKLRNKEIDDICNQVGVIHPIMYDGYDLCEEVKIDELSAFTVSTLRTICKHFELSFRSKDNKPCFIDKIKEMVREYSCSQLGPTD